VSGSCSTANNLNISNKDDPIFRHVLVAKASNQVSNPGDPNQGDQSGANFRPSGERLLLAVFYYISSPTFLGYFFPLLGYAFIWTKRGWATLWATFLQTHLATLTRISLFGILKTFVRHCQTVTDNFISFFCL
jgi:hypothetical protein